MGQLHMGINLGHDRSVAIVRDGKILVAIEQERLDRIKHSVGFMVQSPHLLRQIQVPGESIRYCLDTLSVPLSAMATITANMPGHDHGPSILRGKFSRDISEQVVNSLLQLLDSFIPLREVFPERVWVQLSR